MKFEEIFSEEGLYTADSFSDGVAIKIKENPYNRHMEMFFVGYMSIDDIQPHELNIRVYKGLFDKDYKKVFNRAELFNK